jgi:hypothetical protein
MLRAYYAPPLSLVALLVGMLALVVVTIAAPAEAARRHPGIPVRGTLSDGGSFVGKILYRDLSVSPNQAGNALVLRGVIRGVATLEDGTKKQVQERFSTKIVSLTNGGDPKTCDILNLDLGPIHLDLLGLVVDLNRVHLDITGQTGQGKLLGNLLCGLVGIINPPT